MPEIRPFRALRFDPEAVGDLARVVSPPYDVIGPVEHRTLLERASRNVVRLDLPADEPGDQPDDRYRRAARTFAAWRSDGTLHKDPHPCLYLYEQTYTVPGTDVERTQLGYFSRVRLEPFVPGGGILPHERTLAGPKEDRYKLLRATGANLSPVVGLYEDRTGRAAALVQDVAAHEAEVDLRDDDGVHHRLWAIAEDGPGAEIVQELIELAGASPITIADGHHRYETALRYRDERRMTRTCDPDPAYDFLLMLLLESSGQRLTVLPTHRVVRGVGDEEVARLWGRLDELFHVEAATRDALEGRFTAAALARGGDGRFGLWSRRGGALLTAKRTAFEAILPLGGQAVRALDVSLLQATLERLLGIDPAATAAGLRLSYTKSASEALDQVDAATDGADLAFLLEPTPVESIARVAEDGDVMPQKSTYFYPKALSGLVINPHEW